MNTAVDREPQEGRIAFPGGLLHYLDWGGSGPQIHFLHGNGFCAGTYTPFLRHLMGDFHIFASDVRGHGGSTFADQPRVEHWELFAVDLKRIVAQVMIPPVIGMGHSLGAVATLIAAADDPDLFAAIILIDPVIFPKKVLWLMAVIKALGLHGRLPLARSARKRRRVFRDKQSALRRFTAGRGIFKSWSKEFVEAYLECGLLEKDAATAVLRCDPELEAQIFESVPLNIWSYTRRIACPVLTLRGKASDAFPPAAARRLKSIIPELELVEIADTGHFLPMEQPQECARVIAEFLHKQRFRQAADAPNAPASAPSQTASADIKHADRS